MRICFILLLVAAFQLSAESSYSQITSLSFSMKNKTIEDVMDKIEQDTEFSFLILDNMLDLNKVVNVNANNETVDKVLTNVFKNTNINYKVVDRQIVLMNKDAQYSAINQQAKKQIRGTILDEAGEPVIGASIVERGTTNGVITDINGAFSISITENAELQITYIGYVMQVVKTAGLTMLNIVMKEDTQALDEVVVIGYGTMRKSDLTGATASIKSDVLEMRTVTSVNQALSGKVSGVNIATNSGRPGGRATVRIRGNSSISVTNEPLYVIDGVILNVSSPHTSGSGSTSLVNGASPIDFLNPNDIKSVEVLKDASATAIYGARGANGVILITTKRGESVSGALVSYNTDFGVGILPKKLDVLNAEEFLRNEELAYTNAAKFDPTGFAAGNYRDPKTKRTDTRLFDGSGRPLYDTDWQDEAIRDAFSQTHQISVSNTKGKDSYGFSVGFRGEEGLIVKSKLNRYSGRFFLDSEVTNWLTVGGSLSYNYQDERQTDAMGDGGITVGRQIVEGLPIIPVKYPDGTWAGNNDYPGMEGGNNPVHVATDRDYSIQTQSMLGNVFANIKLMEGLEFRSIVGTNIINQKVKFYGGRQLIWISSPNGSAWLRHINNTSWQFENYITYNKTFADVHRLTAMVGMSWQHVDNSFTRAAGTGFQDDFFAYNNLGVATTQTSQSSVNAYGLNSYFARLNYNLREKYLLTLTGRFDTSHFHARNRVAGKFSGRIRCGTDA